jgi:hypothetical protein
MDNLRSYADPERPPIVAVSLESFVSRAAACRMPALISLWSSELPKPDEDLAAVNAPWAPNKTHPALLAIVGFGSTYTPPHRPFPANNIQAASDPKAGLKARLSGRSTRRQVSQTVAGNFLPRGRRLADSRVTCNSPPYSHEVFTLTGGLMIQLWAKDDFLGRQIHGTPLQKSSTGHSG